MNSSNAEHKNNLISDSKTCEASEFSNIQIQGEQQIHSLSCEPQVEAILTVNGDDSSVSQPR